MSGTVTSIKDDCRRWPRERQVILFAMGTLEDLKAAGLLDGGAYKLAESGRLDFEQMKAASFTVTEHEMRQAIVCIQMQCALRASGEECER